MIRPRLFRTVRLICLLTAALAVCVPAESASVRKSSPSKSSQRLTLKKRPPTAAKTPVRRRQSSVVRSRVALQARQLAEAQQPRFKLDDTGALVPDVRAEAAIIYNPANGKILWETNSQDQRSIASITKVMTAVVFLENPPDLFAP